MVVQRLSADDRVKIPKSELSEIIQGKKKPQSALTVTAGAFALRGMQGSAAAVLSSALVPKCGRTKGNPGQTAAPSESEKLVQRPSET